MMESETGEAASGGGTPAPYGRACTNCARAKCRCIYRPEGTDCERYDLTSLCMAWHDMTALPPLSSPGWVLTEAQPPTPHAGVSGTRWHPQFNPSPGLPGSRWRLSCPRLAAPCAEFPAPGPALSPTTLLMTFNRHGIHPSLLVDILSYPPPPSPPCHHDLLFLGGATSAHVETDTPRQVPPVE